MFDATDIPLVPRLFDMEVKLEAVIGTCEKPSNAASLLHERDDGLIELHVGNKLFALGELIIEGGLTKVVIREVV